MYAVTSTPEDSRTRATFRSAEFGFFGVVVYTRVHTPRRWGEPLSAGVLVLLTLSSRPLRTSWLMVGTAQLSLSRCERWSVAVRPTGCGSADDAWSSVVPGHAPRSGKPEHKGQDYLPRATRSKRGSAIGNCALRAVVKATGRLPTHSLHGLRRRGPVSRRRPR